jgi:hypothetical protein
MHSYNTQRPQIRLKEYGRNIHTMVQNLLQVQDRESRNQQAKGLVDLMKTYFGPGVRDTNDLMHKLWDDLFIMSDFELDVDSPFPKPDRSIIDKKPQRLGYNTNSVKMRHYGKNLELLAQQIADLAEGEEKEQAILYYARLLKTFYTQYNRENVDDEVIIKDLKSISQGKLQLDLEKARTENVFDSNGKERRFVATNDQNPRQHFGKPRNGGPGRNHIKNRNNRNNRKK